MFRSIVNQTNDSTISLLDLQSNPINNTDCAVTANEAFAKAFSSCTNPVTPSLRHKYGFPMDPISIDFDGIVRINESLTLSFSYGPDVVNTKVLKNTSLYFGFMLSKILNQSLQFGNTPDDWKIGRVITLHKSDDKHSASNYGPISLNIFFVKYQNTLSLLTLLCFLNHSHFLHLSSMVSERVFV